EAQPHAGDGQQDGVRQAEALGHRHQQTHHRQHHGDREQSIERIGHLTNFPRMKPVSTATVARLITSTMAKLAVFIHGMWGTPDVWGNWRTVLGARGWQTMAPSLRLHDAAPDAPPGALGVTSLLDYVADLEAELRGLPEKPVV